MLVVVGLGNPGIRYRSSRHNVGFRVVDMISKQLGIRLGERRTNAVLGKGTFLGHEVVLAKPRTFMNNSGEGVEYLLARFGGGPSELLVVYDEMALPTGRIRLRASGSHAGHNGIRSIISAVQTDGFPRLRIGVGQPSNSGESVPHVLGKFSKEEEPLIAQAVQDAVSAVHCMLEESIDVAMTRFNMIGNSTVK